ncbi:MAG: tetratricopeptide repeat protein [Bdellovibrionales bacterium]|nr:tetratricopeptide repeat protein [Bdellovibrionales bacterium]
MSELESSQKVRFPLNKRTCDVNQSVKPDLVLPKEVRKKCLNDFDKNYDSSVEPSVAKLFELGNEAYKSGLDMEAYNYYLKCISSGIESSEILFNSFKNIGNILVRAGDLEGAEEFYNKAYTIYPDSDILLVNLGTLEMQKRDLERAAERYRMAVDVNPSNSRAWIGLALVHREYGDFDLSWGNIERALDVDPSDETALEVMIEWGVKESRFESIIDRLETYININPQNIYMMETLVKVYVVGGRLVKAKNLIHDILLKYPNNTQLKQILNTLETNENINGVVS